MEWNKELENELKEVFSLVNSWLTFAEAKNGAILSVFFGLLYAIKEQIKNNNTLIFLLFLGIFLSLISFYPNIHNFCIMNKFLDFFAKRNKPNEIVKLFYADIAKKYIENGNIKTEEYLIDFSRDYIKNFQSNNFSILAKDYAKEIIINSKIALNKYQLFKLSLIILFVVLIILLIEYWC